MENFFSEQCALRKVFGKLQCPAKIVGLVSEIYSILVSLPSKIKFWSLNLCELFLYFSTIIAPIIKFQEIFLKSPSSTSLLKIAIIIES